MFEYNKNFKASIPLVLRILLIEEIKAFRKEELKRIRAEKPHADYFDINGVGRNYVIDKSKENRFLEIFEAYFSQEYKRSRDDYESCIKNQSVSGPEFLKIVKKHSEPMTNLLRFNRDKGLDVLAEVLGKILGIFFSDIQYVIPSRFCYEDDEAGIGLYLINHLNELTHQIISYFGGVRIVVNPSEWIEIDFKTIQERLEEIKGRITDDYQKNVLQQIINHIDPVYLKALSDSMKSR